MNNNSESNVGRPRKYYIISGEGFKTLLMLSGTTKGKQTRTYYLKVEKLAFSILEHNLKLQDENTRLMELKMQEMKILLDDEKEKTLQMQEKIKTVESYDYSYFNTKLHDFKNRTDCETVYMITTKEYFKKGIFKIGRTSNLDRRCMQINGTRIKGDEFVKIHEVQTYNSKDLESRLHKLLEPFRWENKKEFFLGKPIIFIKMMDILKDGLDADTEELIEILLDLQKKSWNMEEGIPTPTLALLKAPDVDSVWPEMSNPELSLVIKALNNFASANNLNYDYEKDSRTKSFAFRWSNIHSYLEAAFDQEIKGNKQKWKTLINNLRSYGAKTPFLQGGDNMTMLG